MPDYLARFTIHSILYDKLLIDLLRESVAK